MRSWKERERYLRRSIAGIMVVVFALVLSAVPTAQVLARAAVSNNREELFKAAAQEFGVPANVLLSVSYNQSRWENHKGEPSVGGGYGLMHLTTPITEVEDGRGDTARTLPKRATNAAARPNTLGEAAQLIAVDENTIKGDDRQNIRAAAALLASYAKQANNGSLPTKTGAWYDAVTRISGMTNPAQSQGFADDVFKTVQSGAKLTTSDKQTLTIAADVSVEAKPDKSKAVSAQLMQGADSHKRQQDAQQTECPSDITCKFVPARFAQNNTEDPTDYGNYDTANRPHDLKIKYIVIHDTEGSYQSAIDWFQSPASYVAAHYVIRSSDGEVTQMVKNKDVGWQAGNWYVNMHSIGVEHEGKAAEGSSWYTEAMYRSSAKLVRHLADKYQIPLDRQHIIGHDQVPGINPARVPAMHYDPGPYWDWDYYMDLIRDEGDDDWSWNKNERNDKSGDAQAKPSAKRQAKKQEAQNNHLRWGDSKVVRITPDFATNQPPVQCVGHGCTNLPPQGSNFVYLRTEPRADAPLLSDKGLHPDGSPGTTRISDWGSRATAGQKFVVAEHRGNWTAIWFSGQKGWFYNPDSWDYAALPSWSKRVTPKAGKDSIPVYGRPVPEDSAYTNDVPPLTPVPLQYTIEEGQSYTATDSSAKNDYYYVSTFDRSNPGDGTIVVGDEKYIPIEYHHRLAYAKASDVDMKWY